VPQYNGLPDSTGDYAATMKSNRKRPCTCGHAKSIHARMYFKVKPVKLPKNCNFPGCKCKTYKRAATASK
jgi:hypothetical protein